MRGKVNIFHQGRGEDGMVAKDLVYRSDVLVCAFESAWPAEMIATGVDVAENKTFESYMGRCHMTK